MFRVISFVVRHLSNKMIEQGMYFFIFTGIFITWIRPTYCTLTTKVTKEWLEFWMALATLTLMEIAVFPDFSRELGYHFIRTMSLFVLSERAAVAARPKAKDLKAESETEELSCDSFPEKIVHLERFDEKTEVWIIEKLLQAQDQAPFELETKVEWVAMPKTIRSCSAYKLAMLMSTGNHLDQQLVNYAKSQIPALLVALVQSPLIDERDSGILAMSYFVDRCKKVRKVFFHMNIFDVLGKFMTPGTKPLCTRAAVAVCRRVYYERDQAKDEFIRTKRTLDLIKLLESEVVELVAETAEAVKDLVMKTHSILNKKFLEIMANQGLNGAVQKALEKHGANNKMKIALKTIETLIKSL